MTRLITQAMRRFFLATLVISALAAPVGAIAAEPADKPASAAEAEHLIQTIEDPLAREKLVAQLRLLVQADKAEPAEEAGLIPLISDKMQEVSDEILATFTALSDVGRLSDWVAQQAADPHLRARWSDTLGKLAAILGGGILAERLLILLLTPPRRLLEMRQPRSRWTRLPLAVGRGLLDLVPVGGFTATAYALLALPILKLTGDAGVAAVLLISAWVLVRGVLVLAQALFMPRSSTIRVLPLDDETANYLYIWSRRLTYTGICGYFFIQALKMLGLPKSGYGFALKSLGLMVTTLLVILVLQNRQTVAQWLRTQSEASGLNGKLSVLRNRLADVWHILAGLYITAAFLIWALQVKGGFEYMLQASVLTVVILTAAHLLNTAAARLVSRFFSIGEDLRGQFPQLESRVNRYCAIMLNVMRGVVAVGTLLALMQAWGVNTLAWLTSDLGRRLISSALSIAAVLVGALILWELVNGAIERYLRRTDQDGNQLERSARARTLLPLLRNVVMVVLVVLVSLIVLSELGVDIAPLLAGAGVVGVAIGFGSQKLVQDVITGAFILFEDTIAVGDVVKIAEHTGVVEGMTIRTIRLRDMTGQVHTLPFSNVATVTNMSRDFAYYLFDIGVAYREDTDEVMGVMKQLGAEMQADPVWGTTMTDPVEVFGIDKFDASAVVIRGRIKTLPGKQWAAGREFNRRIKKRFDELGIEMPFPTTTLYFGQDKKGGAPAANISISERRDLPVHEAVAPSYAGDAVNFPIGDEARI